MHEDFQTTDLLRKGQIYLRSVEEPTSFLPFASSELSHTYLKATQRMQQAPGSYPSPAFAGWSEAGTHMKEDQVARVLVG